MQLRTNLTTPGILQAKAVIIFNRVENVVEKTLSDAVDLDIKKRIVDKVEKSMQKLVKNMLKDVRKEVFKGNGKCRVYIRNMNSMF